MPTYQQIERFTLAFHRRAIERLRADPSLRAKALGVLDRWESSGVSPGGQPYRDQWRKLLAGGVEHLERAVCADTEEAATLRSMSPLGFVLDEHERLRIRHAAMEP
jgi:hypothetical protein